MFKVMNLRLGYKRARKMRLYLFRTVSALALCCLLVVSGCDDSADTSGSGVLRTLPGTVTVTGDRFVGQTLTAVYSGNVPVTYQWNRWGNALNNATNQDYTLIVTGAYSVTVRAEGYKPLTSLAFHVTAKPADGGSPSGDEPAIPVTGVSLNKTTTSITAGGTETLTATVTPANATNPAVTWSSSNPAVAAVTQGGVVSGVSAGTANITVTTADGVHRAVCAVTVNTDLDMLLDYLTGLPPNTADTPHPLPVIMNLDSGGWDNLMSTLDSTGKYVNLDLSGSTGMTTFDPGTSNTGESFVVSLMLPEASTAIVDGSPGNSRFRNFTNLRHIDTGNGITSIGDNAFQNLSLTSVIIGNNVTSITQGAFANCTSLTSITIPDSVTSIGWGAFQNCSSLASVTIPDSVTFIGDRAFDSCSSLESITIPDSVTPIGQFAFSGCTNLTSATIQNGVTSIGNNAFQDCTRLTNINIPDSVTSIGNNAFQNCSSLISIIIPDSVTSIIGDRVFSGCTNLTSVTIGNGITTIGRAAFENCTSLTSLTIGNSVTNIVMFAFSGCSSLNSVIIPASVTTIGNGAFDGCTNLQYVTFDGTATTITASSFPNGASLLEVYPANGTGMYMLFAGTWMYGG